MLHFFDYAVIVAFLIFLLGTGWAFRRFSGDSSQYFRGGGRMAWWLVGASAFMGAFSAWTFTGAAGLAYQHGLAVLVIYWAGAFGFLCNAGWFAAWFRQTRAITSMEAVRARLGPANEQVFTWLTLPIGIIVAGIWLYGLAIFCAPVFGIDLQVTVLLCGVVVVFMATVGGQWAIVAGDFVQALMLMPIAIVTAVVAWTKAGGWAGISAGLPAGHFDLTAAGVSGFGPWWVAAIILDKFFIQNALHGAGRYLNVRDGRDARKAALLAAGLFALGSIVWFVPPLAARAMGIDLAAQYPGLNQPAEAAYVAVAAQCLPVGVLGLMVTGIMSATLSSMDHGLNRNAGVFVRSVYVPLLRPKAGDREQVLAGRIATLVFGGVVILTALMYTSWKNLGVFNLMLGFSALLGVPYAVPMVWCLLVRRVPDWAAWSAVFAGVAGGAAVGSAQTWMEWLRFQPDGLAMRLAGWAGENHYAAVTLGGALASTLWFFAGKALFGRTLGPERRQRIDEFFTTMRTPVPRETAEAEETDAMGTQGIGRLCLACAGFCALLLLLPNGAMGRIAITFCVLFIGLAGWALVRVGRRRCRETARLGGDATDAPNGRLKAAAD